MLVDETVSLLRLSLFSLRLVACDPLFLSVSLGQNDKAQNAIAHHHTITILWATGRALDAGLVHDLAERQLSSDLEQSHLLCRDVDLEVARRILALGVPRQRASRLGWEHGIQMRSHRCVFVVLRHEI